MKIGVLYAKEGQKSENEIYNNGTAQRPWRTARAIAACAHVVGRRRRWSLLNGHTEHGSPAFDEFLGLLGERIKLEGWNKFRGGLDCKSASMPHRNEACSVIELMEPVPMLSQRTLTRQLTRRAPSLCTRRTTASR